jgi:hypothetical protein
VLSAANEEALRMIDSAAIDATLREASGTTAERSIMEA